MRSDRESHPTRVRGLKALIFVRPQLIHVVAPHAGAWIERSMRSISSSNTCRVAPHAGAWIESLVDGDFEPNMHVAPHAGAWIESRRRASRPHPEPSHPTRVRGLKVQRAELFLARWRSHPTRVRGLKAPCNQAKLEITMSHPTRVRGLKEKWISPAWREYQSVAPHAGAWIERLRATL